MIFRFEYKVRNIQIGDIEHAQVDKDKILFLGKGTTFFVPKSEKKRLKKL